MADSKQVLKSMKKQQLENVCVVHGIECGTKQTKAQLVEKIAPVVSDTSTLDRFYPYMSDKEICILRHYVEHQSFLGIWDVDKLAIFENIGYVCQKGESFLISDILSGYLRQEHHALEKKRKQFDLIMQYFTACSTLYGIFPYDLAIDLYCKYEHKRLNKEEKNTILDVIYIKSLPFEPVDEYMVNYQVFLRDDAAVEELFALQAGKPYAILPKDELLKYVDADYVEKNKYYKKMAAMICLLFGLGSKEADDLTNHLSLMAKAQWEFDMVFEFLEEQFDVAFESMEEYNQFLAVYTEMSNHTRIWENCGYSPAQLRTRMRTL